MNNVYFGCRDCKMYVNAGYRWAYWQLQYPGIVDRRGPISASAVLAAANYWEPVRDEQSEWLYADVFPSVRRFFDGHGSHRLVYGESDDLGIHDYDVEYLEWLEVGSFCPDFTPRTFVELLGFDRWEQVESHISTMTSKPWWWGEPTMESKVKEKFEALVASRRG